MVKITERRESERLSLKDVKIQFFINGVLEDLQRDVRDISYKGLSFSSIKNEHIQEGTNYNFILSASNKSLVCKGRVLYFKNSYFGLAFAKGNIEQIHSLFYFLDPAYVGEQMVQKKQHCDNGQKYLRYESVQGSSIEYSKDENEEILSISFHDKKMKWNTKQGLVFSINDEVTGKFINLSSDTSLQKDIVWQFKKIMDFAQVDKKIKDLFNRVIK